MSAPPPPDDDVPPPDSPPSPATLAWAAERLGCGAHSVRTERRLSGGSHAATHLLSTGVHGPEAILRRFHHGDSAPAREARVLAALDGLDGFAPRLLGVDPLGERCGLPAVLITRLRGRADITPADPDAAAAALGRALARLHAVPVARVTSDSGITTATGLDGFRDGMATARRGTGPAAAALERHGERLARQPRVLTHSDFWSGNVLWEDSALTAVVDWSGGCLAPRGYDLAWCRFDLVLLHGPATGTVDVFTDAYAEAAGQAPPDVPLWDLHTLARSHRTVETWVPNYAPLGRPDLTARELRRRHTAWTQRCLAAAAALPE